MKRIFFKYLLIMCICILFIYSITDALAATAEKKILIGLSFSALEEDFWQTLKKVTIENVEKYGGETTVVSAENDVARQISQIEDLIVLGVDAIIVVAVDADAIVPVVNSAVGKGIPVIAMNRPISPAAKVTCYVGTDNILAGEISAEYIAEKLNGKGKVAILNGPAEALVARDRNEGYVNGLKKYPGIEIVTQKWGLGQRGSNMNNMEDILTTFPDIVAVFGFSDNTSLGASDAITARGLRDKIIIGSIDGEEESTRLMVAEKDFPIKISVAQDPWMMAKYSALVAYEAAIGNKVPVSINTWIKPITPDNAQEYLDTGIFN